MMQFIQQHSSFLGRLLISLLFLAAGLNKITAYAGTASYMEAMGVPSILLPAVIVLEILGALAIIIGFKTRLVAFLLAGFSLLSALIFHFDFADQMQATLFMKNVAIAGGFLFLVAHGPGTWAIDNRQHTNP